MKRAAIGTIALVLLAVLVYGSIFPVAELAGEVAVLRSFDGSGAVVETRMWIVDWNGTPWVRGRSYRG